VQHSLREEPPEVREPPRLAVHASPPARPLIAVVARVLLVSTGIGLFLALVGAFGMEREPLLRRCLMVLPYSWFGGLLGLVCFRLVDRMAWARDRPWLAAAVSGLVMTPPMSLFVFAASWAIAPPGIPVSAVPDVVVLTLTVCVAMCLLGGLMRRRTVVLVHAGAPAPAKFLERLPLKLRGGEVWAVEAEDHYLRLHTSKGQDLILMRLADAVAELDGIEGAQVHRSWWVARDSIAEAERGDGRATLTLKDGAQVPVSRTYARVLRERKWI
jgi:hypothetical protein